MPGLNVSSSVKVLFFKCAVTQVPKLGILFSTVREACGFLHNGGWIKVSPSNPLVPYLWWCSGVSDGVPHDAERRYFRSIVEESAHTHRKILQHERHLETSHWNPSKLHISTDILTSIARAVHAKIAVKMCQFTRILMTRFKVSCMLQNFSPCANLAASRNKLATHRRPK